MLTENKSKVLAVIALIVGLLGGSIFNGLQTPSVPQSNVVNDIVALEQTISDLNETHQLEIAELENTIIELNQTWMLEKEGLETLVSVYQLNITNLEQKHDALKNDYTLFLTTHDITDVKNKSRMEAFTLFPGETVNYEYDVGYGILWCIELMYSSSSGTRFENSISWRQGEFGGIVSSGTRTIEQQVFNITGTVSTEVYELPSTIMVRTVINVSQHPEFCRTGVAELSKK